MAQKTYDDLTVILPTYNEGGNIQSMLDTLASLYPGASIIVADDNSMDETPELVRSFAVGTIADDGLEAAGCKTSQIRGHDLRGD